MKRIGSLFLALVIALTLVPAAAPVASADHFVPVTGWDMMENMGLGINIGNTLEAWRMEPSDDGTYGTMGLESEIHWGSAKVEQWQFKAIALKGFGNVRIPVSWQPHLDQDYQIDGVWMNRVQQVVDWALDAGLIVTLNMHHEQMFYDFMGAGNYDEAKRYLTAVWTQIAERFKDYPETLIFETMNEPRPGGTGWFWDYKVFEKEIPVLCEMANKLNLDALALIRGSGGNNDKRIVALTIVQADPNLIDLYKHPENDPYTMLGVFYYPGGYEDSLTQLTTALDGGIPVVLKETSPIDYSKDAAEALKWSKDTYAKLAGLSAVPMWWNCAGTGKDELFDRDTNEWNASLVEVFFNAYGKTPGPDYTDPIPQTTFPYELEGPYLDGAFTYWTVSNATISRAQTMVVELESPLREGYTFVRMDSDWIQFDSWNDSGKDRIQAEGNTLTFDLRGLQGRRLGFAAWGAGESQKIKRVYLINPDTAAPNLSTANEWARDTINRAYALDLLPTNLQSNYKQPCTRAEFCALAVALIEKLTGNPIVASKTFDDDNGDLNIRKIGGLEIVTGTGGNNFSPNDPIKRADAAVILEKVARKGLNRTLPEGQAAFGDMNLLPYAEKAIRQMRGTSPGIMSGKDGNKFDPAGTFSREECISTLLKLWDWAGG